jgi:hypothetical protein
MKTPIAPKSPAGPRKGRSVTAVATSPQEAYRISRRLQREEDAATPPLVRPWERRVSAIKASQLKALQLRLFPELPDDRRAAPNVVVRSSVFGVVRRGKRARVTDMPVAAPQGLEIAITGWRLDQHDLDIWLEIMHAAGGSKPGEEVRFQLHTLMKRLGHKSRGGKNDYDSLKARLRQLAQTTVAFASGSLEGVAGAFFAGFAVDNDTGEGVCITNPLLRPLFEDITHLDIEQRRALGQDQLAKALHALLASHAEWLPMRVDTLMQRLGAHYERLRDFKRDLKATLENFVDRGWIRGFQFQPGGRGVELVAISKIPSLSQQRAIEAKRASG